MIYPILIISKCYFKNNQPHRLDGPALSYDNGDMSWYKCGRLHRLDGPAIEWKKYKKWYIDGVQYTHQEFNKLIKLKAFW